MVEPFSLSGAGGGHVDEIVARDGYRLARRTWETPSPRATLILVSGVMSHSGWFRSLAEPFDRRGIRLVAVDRRGSGLNRADRGNAPAPRVLVDDVLLAIEHEGEKRPLLLAGWCWGAIPAVCAALEPECTIDGLVLAAPGIFPSELVKKRMKQELALQRGRGLDEVCLSTPVTEDMFTDGPGRELILADELRLDRFTPRFQRIGAKLAATAAVRLERLAPPVLLVLADRDDAVDNAATLAAFERLGPTRVTARTLASRHGIPFDAPDELAEEIAIWIESVVLDEEALRGG